MVWGTGTPRREFLYVDDLADAVVFLTENYSGAVPVNVGVGSDITIRELAELIGCIVGFNGELVFDTTQARRHAAQAASMSSRLHALGWRAGTSARGGTARAPTSGFCANESQLRR